MQAIPAFSLDIQGFEFGLGLELGLKDKELVNPFM